MSTAHIKPRNFKGTGYKFEFCMVCSLKSKRADKT